MSNNQSHRAEMAEDQLPPHSDEAERGVLGCVFLAPEASMPVCERQRIEPEWFFDLRHRVLWQTLFAMSNDPKGIDVVTIHQRLRDHGNLADAGGLAYLSDHPNQTPSASNLGYYLDILRDKWVLRNLIAECLNTVKHARNFAGSVDALVDRQRAKFDQFAQDHVNPTETSSLLRPAGQFGEAVFDKWFGSGAGQEEPGLSLPETAFGTFPFRIRPKEMTLVLGEKGKGKTTMLSYICLHLLQQGMKAVIASMEMAPDETLETLVRQLLGVKRCADTEEGRKLFTSAVAWLNSRCEILDFRGIIQHRQLLDEFKRASARGRDLFIVDNLMKLGLMEDDMAAHGQAANEFHGFAVGGGAHLFMVNHLNKGGTSRGSLRWVDASNNVCSIDRNEKKWEKLGPGFELLKHRQITNEEFQENYKAELKAWDAKFVLKNQRLQGSLQNGSRTLWFLSQGSQYANHGEPLPAASVNWLGKWTGEP